MSATSPAPIGPREASIKQNWDAVWREYSEGGVYEPHIAIAEAELASFGSTLPPNDAAALSDFRAAQNLHLFQSRYFAAHVGKIEGFREQLKQAVEWTYAQIAKFNEHSVRSLTLANGGVVLATLAYIQAKDAIATGFFWVIGLGAAGYLLTILGSHVVVILSTRPLVLLSELRAQRISEADRNKKLQDLARHNKLMVWCSRPPFYGAAMCLIGALCIGVMTLAADRQVSGLVSQPLTKAAIALPKPNSSPRPH